MSTPIKEPHHLCPRPCPPLPGHRFTRTLSRGVWRRHLLTFLGRYSPCPREHGVPGSTLFWVLGQSPCRRSRARDGEDGNTHQTTKILSPPLSSHSGASPRTLGPCLSVPRKGSGPPVPPHVFPPQTSPPRTHPTGRVDTSRSYPGTESDGLIGPREPLGREEEDGRG